MAVVICGSLAFDTIMHFEGRFKEQILPEQLHILNVSFLVPRLQREFGGCAGNIAYGLKLLGGQPLPMATLGNDGESYFKRLQDLGIATDFVKMVADDYTAQAMIMTDLDNNQITAFHPGAMMQAHITHVKNAPISAWASSRPMAAMPCCSMLSNLPPQAFRLYSTLDKVCPCSMAKHCAISSNSRLGSP